MKRVAFHTLGCKLNFSETSTIGREFIERGYQLVDFDEPAEVCVINTCSVTERADRECRQLVRRALRRSPKAFVAVVGCYAQLQPGEIAAIEGVDLVLGTKEKFNLFDHTNGFVKQDRPRIVVSPIREAESFHAASSMGFGDRTRAFLKIQDGCDFTCSFCTIPLARGESRSVAVSEIILQAREIVGHGYREIVLTGVNVGDYGKKIGTNLVSLLRAMAGVDGLQRIRISSIEPNLLTDELMDFWLESDQVCNHFHIPLQSGSDDVLKNMRRRYLSDWYRNRVERIKRMSPEAGIGADVIVGFPGETDELFEETYHFLTELPISYLHVFTYSQRPNTHAAEFENQVEPRIRFRRSEMLRNLSLRKRISFHQPFVGRTAKVLFESERTHGRASGLTGEYIRVNVATEEPLINQIRQVTITAAGPESCDAALVVPQEKVVLTRSSEELCPA
jgi:threonylcarbamoyladenosine tRNA methylthiotransferase MtaB